MASLLIRHSLRPLRLAIRPLQQHQPHSYPPSQLQLSLQAQLQLQLQPWPLQVRCQSTRGPSAPVQPDASQKTVQAVSQAKTDASLMTEGLAPSSTLDTSAASSVAPVLHAPSASAPDASAPALPATPNANAPAPSAPENAPGTLQQAPSTPANEIVHLDILQRLGPLTNVVKAYGRQQRKRPWITQLWTAVVIYLCADILAQSISGRPYDVERTGRNLIIGLCMAIPSYEWLIFLGNHFNYRSRFVSLAVKVFIAQTFFTPLFNTYFFGMQALLAGASWPEIVAHVKATVPTSCLNSCKVWPTVTALSFAFLAPEYRNAFNGLVAIFWQTYLSFLNRSAQENVEKIEAGLTDVALAVKVNLLVTEGPTQEALTEPVTDTLTEGDVAGQV
ncbi:hypothetical protein BROUX41_005791 [Berkeleyomyces rouxiae]